MIGGGAVGSSVAWVRDWRYGAAVVTIVCVFAVDLAFPATTAAPFMCVPVVAAATFARPLAVASLAGLAVAADLVAGSLSGDFASPEFWLRLAILVVFGLLAVVLARLGWGWRSRLRGLEARARLLAENATDVVFEGDMDGRLTWLSPSITAEAGWHAEELIGRGLVDVVHPDDARAFGEVLERVAVGESVDVDVRLLTSTGDFRWIAIMVRPRWDGPGAVVGMLGGWRDTQAEHEARGVLERSEARYRTSVDALPDAFFIFTPRRDHSGDVVDLHVTMVNAAAETLLGRAAGEIVGRGLLDLLPSMRAVGVFALVCDVLSSGKTGRMRVPSFDENGVTGAFDVAASPLGGEAVVVATDVTARVRDQAALSESESRYRLLATNVGDVVYTAGLDRTVTWMSPSVQSTLGWTPGELVGTLMADLLHPDDSVLTEPEQHRLYAIKPAPRTSAGFVVRARTRQGTYRWMSAVLSPLTNEGGSQIGVVGSLTPVDDLVEARREAQVQRARLQATLDSLLDPHVMLDAVRDGSGRIVDFVYADANDAACAYNGIARADLLGRRLLDLLPGHAGTGLLAIYADALDSGEPLALDGYSYPSEILQDERCYDIRAVKVGDSLSYTWRDVTDRRKAESALIELATHDPLTGLANRSMVTAEIRRALSAGKRSGRSTAVLMMDLDRFKNVNDSLGHAVGDDLLREAAERLAAVSRGGDLVARLGGDEFVVVLPDVASRTEAQAAASRLVNAFRQPFLLNGRELYATASVGIAVSTGSTTPEDMLRESDTALYAAKDAGRDTSATFDEALGAKLTSRLSIESGLRHALERGQLATWYQPEVDLSTGSIIAVEALVRWHHPDAGTLEADRFIHVAEQTGLILDIGEWVLNQACLQGAAWAADRPDRRIRMRVNVSALQLAAAGLLDALDGALRTSRLDPDLLCIEITETALLRETATVRANIAGIRARGVSMALDDFGTGYASLSYLRRFPVDVVKIDRSFITHMTTVDRDRQLVAAIVTLSTTLGLTVTAEGLEHPDQCALLRELGCSGAQGYLFSRAVPAQKITELLDTTFALPKAGTARQASPRTRPPARPYDLTG
jgi:diguanylate cyclase (GGDEF)-like protein/PAS domain S-box-containing protein